MTKYVQPTRDGEIDRWRVSWEDGAKEDLESFEVRQRGPPRGALAAGGGSRVTADGAMVPRLWMLTISSLLLRCYGILPPAAHPASAAVRGEANRTQRGAVGVPQTFGLHGPHGELRQAFRNPGRDKVGHVLPTS